MGQHFFLELAALVAQGGLKSTEVVNGWNVLAAAHTALGVGPGLIPLDGTIDFPVCENKLNLKTSFSVGLYRLLDPPSHFPEAEVQGKGTAHVMPFAKGVIEKGFSLGIAMCGAGVAIAECVGTGSRIDGNGQTQLRLDFTHSQSLIEVWAIISLPACNDGDPPLVELPGQDGEFCLICRPQVADRPQVQR